MIRTRFTSLSHMTHYLTCAETPMTHTDSGLITHYLQIVPYDIITDVTMTHADSRLLINLRHHDSSLGSGYQDRIICLFNTNILY